jgi:type IV pilus assembly protein PilV
MRHREDGFTLVEVLVALVIFAVGLLGIAALHIESLNAGRTALNRTQAVALASDLADRIRANREACTPSSGTCEYESDPGAVTAACENTTGCTPAQLAATDIFRWRAIGAAQLPGFDATVDWTAGTPNVYLITVEWVEPGAGDNNVYELRLQI